MKYLLIIFILVINYTDCFAQKNDKSFYFKTNLEGSSTESSSDDTKFKHDRMERYEQILGYKVDKDKYAVKIGIVAFGFANMTKKTLSSNHYSRDKISTQSFGIESSYIFKLSKPKKETSIILGVNAGASLQYVHIKRNVLDSFTYKETSEVNETFKSIVFGPAVGVFLQKKISEKIVLDLDVDFRFFSPTYRTAFLFLRKSVMASITINYKLN